MAYPGKISFGNAHGTPQVKDMGVVDVTSMIWFQSLQKCTTYLSEDDVDNALYVFLISTGTRLHVGKVLKLYMHKHL